MMSSSAPHGWDALSVLRVSAGFAVPAFVFMAAALSWGRPPAPDLGSYARFMGRRLSSLLPAYLAWSFVYWCISYFGFGFRPPSSGGSVGFGAFVWGLLSGDTWSHLYFVPVVVLVYALTPLAGSLMRWRPAAAFIIPIVAALLWWGARGSLPAVSGTGLLSRIVGLLPAAAAGAWYSVGRRRALAPGLWRVPGWPLSLLGGLAVTAVTAVDRLGGLPDFVIAITGLLWPILVTVGLLGACASLCERVPRVATAAAALAPLTYVVYLAHPALLVLLYRITRSMRFNAPWVDARLLLFKWGYTVVTSAVLAALLVFLMRRVRDWLGSAVGNR
jgi:peptidoglycan/LPS O-acetylase OafA/YrhL